ncbi:MAG: PIN domain-containing protein [Gammaproteobacteria bacterium]|nr:PIN domain-containing protein [Gammaproteobacteria bacterium]MDE0223766.1 PIN domain-containing protein [Gammaproteobacteria bacterium]
MRTLFDTSVVVAALVDQLGTHEAAFREFRRHSSGENAGFCSTHALAEIYATLTALPLQRRISPDEARRLLEETVLARLAVVPLGSADYRAVLRQVADQGLGSGAIYDALHAHCARKEGVDQILTYNLQDFERFDLEGILVAAP